MATSDCEKIRDMIPLYLDNMLSDEEYDMVREHIKICPDCAKELSFMKAVTDSTQNLASPMLSADFHEKLMEKVKKEPRTVARDYRVIARRSFMRVAAAAAVVALSVVSFLNLETGTDSVNPDQFTIPSPTAQVQKAPDMQKEEEVVAPDPARVPVKSTPKKTVEKRAEEQADVPVAISETETTVPFAQNVGRMAEGEDVPATASEDGDDFAVAETPKTQFVKVFVTVAETDVPLAETILQAYPKDRVGYLVEEGLEDVLSNLSTLSGYTEEREYSEEINGDYIVLQCE